MGGTGNPYLQASREYLTNAVMTATPEKLVVLLYDGAMQAIDRAITGFQQKNRAAAGEQIGKAYSIVGELRATLNLEEGGEVAAKLFSLYGFVLNRITTGNMNQNVEALHEAKKVLATIREGWDALARST